MKKYVAAALFLLGPSLGLCKEDTFDVESSEWTSQYDALFQQYTEELFEGEVDWRLFKIQAIAESGLRRKVRHKSGATGLMQLMPATFREIKRKQPHFRGKDLHSAEWNIAAGLTYNRYLYGRWEQFEGEDRLAMMLASYNAGYSRTLKALNRAKSKSPDKETPGWEDIRAFVPKSTRRYVERILGSLPRQEVGEAARERAGDSPSLVLAGHKVLENGGDHLTEPDAIGGMTTILDWMVALPVTDSSQPVLAD